MAYLTQIDQRKLFLSLGVSTAIMIAVTLGLGMTQWYKDWQLANGSTKIMTTHTDHSHPLNLNKLPEAHLFGQSPNMDVPISNLQFRLTGIVASTNKNSGASKAYISVGGQSSKIFQTGDQLPFGVKIYEIKQNTVILSKDGKFEKLPLSRLALEFKPLQTGDTL